MEVLKDKYTITELSNRLNVTDHALRYYEKEFHLQIPKDDRGRRFYTPELANVMYQIKTMRDQGLEIKAIRKILQDENVIKEPPPVVTGEETVSVIPYTLQSNSTDMKKYFDDFRDELTTSITLEVGTARDHLTKEISKSKLELGACVENSVRKLESKLEKHFQDVDRSLGLWRERNRKNFFKRLLEKTIK